jgi:ferredoxin-NADP reductase
MAASAREIIYWLQDVREHLRVSRRRKELRQPGQGFDYTQDKDTVQRVVSRFHPRRMRLHVTEIIQETPTTKTFRFERTDGPLPPFRPGQYINVFVDVDGVLTSRPYSIASPPQAGGTKGGHDTLELTVRDKPGGFVAPYLLNEVQVGDELETTGPTGNFYHEPLIDGDDLVFLAGGSGITPFMSIIRDAIHHDRPPFGELRTPLKIHLLYGSRVPDDVIYGDELAKLAANHPNLNYSLVISEPPLGDKGDPKGRPYLTGFLDANLIREQVGDPSLRPCPSTSLRAGLRTSSGQAAGSGQALMDKTFYICGPNVMYDFCLAALEELGVPPHKIRRELYGPPADVTKEPGWPEGLSADTVFSVEVVGQKTIHAPAGEPLLNTLERYGIVVPAVCRSGECSACRIRLFSGKVFMPARTGLRESDRQHGYIHACVSYPLEDLRIRL